MPSAPRANVPAKHVADADKNTSRRAAKRRAHAGSDDDGSDTRKRSKRDAPVKEEPEIVVLRESRDLLRRSRARRARARHAGSASSSQSASSASTPRSRTDPEPEPEDDETPRKKGGFTPRVKDFAPDISLVEPSSTGAAEPNDKDPSSGLTSMEEEIAQLKRQLSERDQVIEQQHSVLTAVHNTLQCQVCLDILSKPFVLPKCGHVCCQGCLESWFAQSPQAEGLYDGQEPPLHARRKTCPHCREVVQTAPTKLYIVRNLASIMDAPGVLDKTTARPATREPSVLAPDDVVDPFARFFAPERPRGPIIDYDDGGILRCESCLGEVWHGSCVICGRRYAYEEFSDALDESYGEEDDEDGSESDNSLGDFLEYDEALGVIADMIALHRRHEHYDEDDEEEEELGGLHDLALDPGSGAEDEDSHVEEYSSAREEVIGLTEELTDDEEEEQPVRASRLRRGAIPVASLEETEEGDDEDEEVHDAVYHSRPSRVLRGASRIIVDSEEEDSIGEGEDDEGSSIHQEGSLADERLTDEEYWSNEASSQDGGSDDELW